MSQLQKNIIIFILLVGLQILVILGLFANRMYILTTGREVALATLPVDPRDLIRGEYVNLRYEIGTVSRYYADAPEDLSYFYNQDGKPGSPATPSCTSCLQVGDTVYVVLTSYDNKVWRVDRVDRVQPKDFSVFLKGTVESVDRDNASIYYGIEKYFVEAGSGLALERSGNLLVYVSIGKDGSAVIKRVEPVQEGQIERSPTRDVNSSRRDSRRVADIKELQMALELYYDANNESYPEDLSLLVPLFIPEVPRDPSGSVYLYQRISPKNYLLQALLEDPSSPVLRSDSTPGDMFFDVTP